MERERKRGRAELGRPRHLGSPTGWLWCRQPAAPRAVPRTTHASRLSFRPVSHRCHGGVVRHFLGLVGVRRQLAGVLLHSVQSTRGGAGGFEECAERGRICTDSTARGRCLRPAKHARRAAARHPRHSGLRRSDATKAHTPAARTQPSTAQHSTYSTARTAQRAQHSSPPLRRTFGRPSPCEGSGCLCRRRRRLRLRLQRRRGRVQRGAGRGISQRSPASSTPVHPSLLPLPPRPPF